MSYKILEKLNGKVCKNHTSDIAKLVGADFLTHDADFVFRGKRGNEQIFVTTKPTDENETEVMITEIRANRDGLYGTIEPSEERTVTKVNITYRMIRGKETAETFIAMPISIERYNELAAGCTPENKAWHEIREALATLTKLQGYDELGSWNIELTIET